MFLVHLLFVTLNNNNMTDELKKVEARIKKKHRFGWTPKYEEEFRTDLNQTVFATVACMAFEDLDCEVVYQDTNCVEAKRRNSSGKWREKITASF